MDNNLNNEEKELDYEILKFFLVCNDMDFKAFIEEVEITPITYFGILATFEKIDSIFLRSYFLEKHKNFIKDSISQGKHPRITKKNSSYT